MVVGNAVFAADRVGVPMAPNSGDAALPIRQITQAVTGLNPSATNIAAGIATAVPNPAIPSMKLEKPQPITRAATRLSLDTDASIALMTSIAPVLKLMLYRNMAPTIITQIGHTAETTPSKVPVIASGTVM